MTVTTIVGPLAAISLVLLWLQSTLCLRMSQPTGIRALGVLTGVLAGVGSYGLLAGDRVVISRAAGLLMTWGTAGWWPLAVFIVAVPIAGAFAVSVGRADGASTRATVTVGVSAIVGLVTARLGIAPLFEERAVPVIYEFNYTSLHAAPWVYLSAVLFLVAFLQSLVARLRAIGSAPPPAADLGPRYLLLFVGLAVFLAGVAAGIRVGDTDRAITLSVCAMGWLIFIEAACGNPLLTHGRQLDGTPVVGWIASMHAWFANATRSELVVTSLLGIVLVVLISEYPNKRHTIVAPFRSADSDANLGRQMSDRLLNEIATMQRELQLDLSDLTRDRARAESVGTASSSGAEDTWAGTQELEFGSFRIPVRLLIAPIDGPIQRLLNIRVIEGSVQVENTVGSDLQRDLAQAAQPTQTPAPRCTTQPAAAGTPTTTTPGSATPDRSPTATSTPATPCITPHDIVVLASSSDGDTWRAERTTCDAGEESWRSEYDAVRGLAFNILGGDRAFAKARFTDTYPAFQQFEAGLEEWQKAETERSDWEACTHRAGADENKKCDRLYGRWQKCRQAVRQWDDCTSTGDDEEDRHCTEPVGGNDCSTRPPCIDQQPLLSAAEDFRYAADIDPAFALALYRLGLARHEACRRDRQSRLADPERADQACTDAIDAVRKSRARDPQFATASLELASLLFDASSRSDGAAEQADDPRQLCQGIFFSPAAATHRAQAASLLCSKGFAPLDHRRNFYCQELAYLSADGSAASGDWPAPQ